MKDSIPLFNPACELKICGDKVFDKIADVANSGIYVNGSKTLEFENHFATFFQTPFAIAVSSGTAALELMLRAEGVGQGDRIITSAHTFVAVLEAILNVGAKPVFVDIDPHTWQMPAGDWKDEIVLASHLYGGISTAIDSNSRVLYEDVSQSLGAKIDGQNIGTIGRIGIASLYPTKNLSAMGDAGVILTDDGELADCLRALRNHGQTKPQIHTYCGTTARMDEIQAVILTEKLVYFDQFLKSRRSAAEYYNLHLSDFPLELPLTFKENQLAPNLYVVRSSQRDELKRFMAERGIITGIHYPTPFHLMPAYMKKDWAQVNLPHTEKLCNELLSLPLWVGISEEQQTKVVETINEFFND